MSPITIQYGNTYEQTALQSLANAKGLIAHTSLSNEAHPIELHTKNILVRGFHPCLLYIEAKYPYPTLLYGDPESQAAMLMVLESLNHPVLSDSNPIADLIEQASEARPFLLGSQASLVDIAAAPYRKFMPATYQRALDELLCPTK